MWWAGSMLLTNRDDAVNKLEYLSDKDINDNANYVNNDFKRLFAIDNTNFTESQEQAEWVNLYGNTNNLDTLPVELPDQEQWDVASQNNIDFNDVTTLVDVNTAVHSPFWVQSESEFYHLGSSSPVKYSNTSCWSGSCGSLSDKAESMPRPEKKKVASNWKIISHVRNRESD